jgi:hypothetical protein
MAKCKVLAFLLCDNATRDRDGKITLHGLFDRIIAPKTRNEVRLFYAYYRVVVEEPCVVFMKVAGPEGYEVPGNWRDSLTGSGPMQTVWALSSDLFKMQGSYALELRQEAGDSESLTLAQMRLTVEESEDHSK